MNKFNYKYRKDITNKVEKEEQLTEGSSKKCIVTIDNKKYVFKYNYSDIDGVAKAEYLKQQFKENITELNGDICEVFSYYFLKNMNCDFCIPYDFAKYKGRNGCISPYFVSKDTEQISLRQMIFLKYKDANSTKLTASNYKPTTEELNEFYGNYFKKYTHSQYQFSVPTILQYVTEFCDNYKLNVNLQELENKLNKIVIYDYFMLNWDRNWQNIIFLQDKQSNLTLSPLFDHGECFMMENFDRLKENYVLDENTLEVGLSTNGELYDFSGNNYFNNQQIIAVDIAELSTKDKEAKNLVDMCLNLDIQQLIENFENDYNLKLPQNYKEVIELCYNLQKEKYISANEKLNKRLKKSKSLLK